MSISNKLLPKAFAENAGSTYRYDIPDTNDTEFTNKATYDKGFPPVTMTDIAAGGIPPFGQDMNGILCDLTTAIRYLQAGNLARYDASFATAIGGYLKNAVVSDLNANQYRSLVDNNTAELTDTASWVQIDALEKGVGGTVTAPTNFTGALQNKGSDVVTKAMAVDYVIEDVVLSDGASWYRKWKSGIVEQGGYLTGTKERKERSVNLLISLSSPYLSIFIPDVIDSYLHSSGTTAIELIVMQVSNATRILSNTQFACSSYYNGFWYAKGRESK